MKKLFTLAVLSITMIGAASAQSLTQDQIEKLKKDLAPSGFNSNPQTTVVVDAQTLKSKLSSMDFSTMGKFFVVQNVTLLNTEFTNNPDERHFFGESSKVIRGSVTPVSTSTTPTPAPTPAPIAPRPVPGSDPRFGGNQLIWLGSPNPTPPQAPSLLAHKDIQATFDLGSNIALICVVDDENNLNRIKVGTKVKSITIYVDPKGIAKIAHITL
jgi:hypothetical protein